ncbi:MAG: beta-ketoacyl-[acyl-carrier-protein] synthase family protein [Bacteroidota bacterium]
MNNRVVITGIGVISPNGIGKNSFVNSIRGGVSGIRNIPDMEKHNLLCHIGGVPEINWNDYNSFFAENELLDADISIKYGVLSGIEAWRDAGLEINDTKNIDTLTDCGAIIGTTFGGIEVFIRKILPLVDTGNFRKLGSQIMEHFMPSGTSAALSKILALSNINSSNSSACSTGLEAIYFSYQHIKNNKAKLMMTGGTDLYSSYCWAGFDSMRVLNRSSNNNPSIGSRPMSATASGFVPAAGSSVLILEELEHAIERNAPIYAEIVGASVNSGGQRNGGSMTFPNPKRVIDCIQDSIHQANIKGDDINLICGHLTGTKADSIEINNWVAALNLSNNIPYINSLKSMTGHLIGAAGALETAAAVLQLHHDFVHPSINSEDLHPEIAKLIPREKIPLKIIENAGLKYIAKASFGFGDVNSCIILKKYE